MGEFSALRIISTFQTENPVMNTSVAPPQISAVQVSARSRRPIKPGILISFGKDCPNGAGALGPGAIVFIG